MPAVGLLTAEEFFSAAMLTTLVAIVSLHVLRPIEDRLVHPGLGQAVRVRVRFRSSGYAPLT